jgi:hypothetical protein
LPINSSKSNSCQQMYACFAGSMKPTGTLTNPVNAA